MRVAMVKQPDLKVAFEGARLIAESITSAECGRVVRLPSRAMVPVRRGDDVCLDPWFIARCVSGSQRRAKIALAREGIEMFYPAGRLLRLLPLRFVPPKKRTRRGMYLQESLRLPYGDYVFVRYMFGSYPLSRLFDIDGMQGLCLVGDEPATVPDYEVELLRLAEHDGRFDRIEAPKMSEKQLALAFVRRSPAAQERWSDRTLTASILDESRRTIHFVEEFGRITSVITS